MLKMPLLCTMSFMRFRLVLFIFFFMLPSAFSNLEKMQKFQHKTKIMFPESQKLQGIKHIPLEMAQFYLAMGISEYWHCAKENDPQSCGEYLQMMSDPISHLGFVFFMVASRKVTHLSVKSRISAPFANYLGLASGLLVQTVFEEIYRHPDMQSFLNARYIEDSDERLQVRKDSLSSLFDKTFGDKQWYADKFPLISSLLISAGLSPVLVRSAYILGKGSYEALKKIVGAKKFQKIDRALNKQGTSLAKFKRRISVQGIRIITSKGKTSSLAPVIYMGEYLVTTITFLELDKIIHKQISSLWSKATARWKLKDGLNELHNNLNKSPDKVADSLKNLETLWDDYRLALSEKSFATYARHIGSLGDMETKSQKIYHYYSWLARGMDRTSDEWIKNENDWHAPGYDLFSFQSTIDENLQNEEDHYINKLFCGPTLEDALEFQVDYSGIPIPFMRVKLNEYRRLRSRMGDDLKLKSYSLSPYKIVDFNGVCESDLEPVRGKKIEKFYTDTARQLDQLVEYFCPVSKVGEQFELIETIEKKGVCLKRLKDYKRYLLKNVIDQNQLLSRVYEDFSNKIPDLLGLFKVQKIRRYEKALQDELKLSLGESSKTIFYSHRPKESVLSSYDNELLYWEKLKRRHPKFSSEIASIIELTEKERESAIKLKEYIDKDLEMRDPSDFAGQQMFEDKSLWEQFWEGLVIQ